MLHDMLILRTCAVLRRKLLEDGLAMPPRSILEAEIGRAWDSAGRPKLSELSGDLLASITLPGILGRRTEFSDPNVVLFDVREWHTEERGRRLARVQYRSFLQTWYWLSISSHIAASAGACELCGCKLAEALQVGGIEVHHLHYRSRGFEVRDLECLSLLCDVCHGAVHGKPRQQGPRLLAQIIGAITLRLAHACQAS